MTMRSVGSPPPPATPPEALEAMRLAGEAVGAGQGAILVAEVLRADSLVPVADVQQRFRVASLLQAAFRFTGEPSLLEKALAACRLVADRTDVPELAIPARALSGNVLMLAGRYHEALEHCDAAVALALATGLAGDRVAAMGHQFRAYLLLEWNRLDEARTELHTAWELSGEQDRGVRSGVARVLAEVALAAGDRGTAREWIGRLEGIVSEPMTLRNREWLAAVRTRHGFAATRDLRLLDAWQRRHDYRIEALEALPTEAIAARLQEMEHLLTMLETGGRWHAAAAVARVLERGSRPLRRWYLVRALSARAVALDALGHPAEAMALWEEALGAAEPGSFVRVFLDGAGSRIKLLRAALPGAAAAEAARVLAAAGVDREDAPALTERQLTVLGFVAEGLADREIAARTGLSIATVKTHLRAVYARLGVGSRTAAVARGRRLGIL
jgi:ATP/maltotriose-dependent transcriptional regulator MalT